MVVRLLHTEYGVSSTLTITTNGRQHWCAAEIYKLWRLARWAGTVGFESLVYYQTIWKCGRVRFIAPVLKTDEQKCSVSSNLTASAKHRGP